MSEPRDEQQIAPEATPRDVVSVHLNDLRNAADRLTHSNVELFREQGRAMFRHAEELEAAIDTLKRRVETLEKALRGLSWYSKDRSVPCWCDTETALHTPSCSASTAALAKVDERKQS